MLKIRIGRKAPGVDQHSHQRGISFTTYSVRDSMGTNLHILLTAPLFSHTNIPHVSLSCSSSFQVGDRRGQGQADVEWPCADVAV